MISKLKRLFAFAVFVTMLPVIPMSIGNAEYTPYTEENGSYVWDLKNIQTEISNYDSAEFQNGASYEYNGLTLVGSSVSVLDENGFKIGKALGYAKYKPQYPGTLSVTANITKAGNYYTTIYAGGSLQKDNSVVVLTGTETNVSQTGAAVLEAGKEYYIFNGTSAVSYIESISFTPDMSMVAPKMTLNNTFSSNMLIQRDKPIKLKGECAYLTGATVTLTNETTNSIAYSKEITDLTDKFSWETTLDPVSDYENTYTLTITPESDHDGAEPIEVRNIIFGDFYLCAGQSNMVATASDYKNMGIDYTKEQLATVHNDIRYLDLAGKVSASSSPKETIISSASWGVLKGGGIPAVAYSFAEKLNSATGIPVGIITSSVKGTYISQWMPNTGIDSNNKSKNLFNAGIYPFRDMQLSGILWYQGESDSREYTKYKDKLITFIHTYREMFANEEEVPFYFVSIVRCGSYKEDDAMFEGMSGIRAAQGEVYSELKDELDNFGIIPTLDIYGNKEKDESFSSTWGTSRGNARRMIHPGQKPIIGERAVNRVLTDIYGREGLNVIGPVYKSKSSADGKLTVEFECTGDLKVMDVDQYSDNESEAKRAEFNIDPSKPQEFEIAGEDGIYYRADAELDGKSVILSCDKVPEPVNFRYAYTGRNGDAYVECPNLTDDTDLPALVVSTAEGINGDAPAETDAPDASPTVEPTASPTPDPTAAPTPKPTTPPGEAEELTPVSASASSRQNNSGGYFPAAYAIDGITEGYKEDGTTLSQWVANGTSVPQYILIDYGQKCSFDEIEIWWNTKSGKDDRYSGYEVYVSDDGDSFEKVLDRTDNTTPRYTKDTLPENTIGRYIKINVTKQSAGNVAIFEVKTKGIAFPREKQYIHISFDDTYVCLNNLINNAEQYDSVFEEEGFGFLKDMHEKYGAVFTFNCFNYSIKNKSYDISNVPSKFAEEFQENDDWLKFAFHAKDDNAIYGPSSAASNGKIDSDIEGSYKKFEDAIMKMTGNNEGSINHVTRLGFFAGTRDSLLKFKELGIKGFFTADDEAKIRGSYYLTEEQRNKVNKAGILYDEETELLFLRSQPRFEIHQSDTTTKNLTKLLNEIDSYREVKMIELFTHEPRLENAANVYYGEYSMQQLIEEYLKWAVENGYGFDFPENQYRDLLYGEQTEPTEAPTSTPTATPTAEPTSTPTATPTAEPTSTPTATPTAEPSSSPTEPPAEYKITDGEIADGKIRAAIFSKDNTVKAYIVQYDEKGALTGVTINDDIKAGENSVETSLNKDTKSVKIILWQDMIPKTEPFVLYSMNNEEE